MSRFILDCDWVSPNICGLRGTAQCCRYHLDQAQSPDAAAYGSMRERDLTADPYRADELRVVEWLLARAPDLGAGNDPIGFLLASHDQQSHRISQLVERLREITRLRAEVAAPVGELDCPEG